MLAPLPVEGQEKEGRDREREDSQQPQIEGREENKEKSIRTNLARHRRGWRRSRRGGARLREQRRRQARNSTASNNSESQRTFRRATLYCFASFNWADFMDSF